LPSLDLLNRVRRSPLLYGAGVALRDIYSLVRSTYRGSFSQHGEDTYVAGFFAGKPGGFYLDIGASHPFRISNTYLLYRSGWRGVTVEPIPRLGELHRRWRPRDTLLPAAVGRAAGTLEFFEMTPSVLSTLDREVAARYVANHQAVIFQRYSIEVMPINRVFEQASAISPIDFVSIDIEGLDTEVLSEVDFARFRPALFCIEFDCAKARQDLEALFRRANYRIDREIGCNLFAVPADS
jgi:FkbM family methyltransferase